MQEIWPEATETTRNSITTQLGDYVKQLRALKLDEPGALGGDYNEGPYFTVYGAPAWTSIAEMEVWFNERHEVCKMCSNGVSQDAEDFTGEFGDLVMCHGDILGRNMILDRYGKLWLVDWGFAGAYPRYFEYAATKRTGEP